MPFLVFVSPPFIDGVCTAFFFYKTGGLALRLRQLFSHGFNKDVISQLKMNLQDIIFLMMYIFVLVYLCIKMPMTSSFVRATPLGRKKSTEKELYIMSIHYFRGHFLACT